jgi:hypothetical protein
VRGRTALNQTRLSIRKYGALKAEHKTLEFLATTIAQVSRARDREERYLWNAIDFS